MAESRNGSANGAGTPAIRASVCALSKNPATQPEVDAVASLSTIEIRSLLSRAMKTSDLDLRPFLRLTLSQVAELVNAPEWQKLCDAMIGLAVLDREDRLTKTQRWALAFFRRSATAATEKKNQRAKTITDDGSDIIDVEGMS